MILPYAVHWVSRLMVPAIGREKKDIHPDFIYRDPAVKAPIPSFDDPRDPGKGSLSFLHRSKLTQ